MFLLDCTITADGRYCECRPSAYHEATRAVFSGMPGMTWDRVRKLYRGPLAPGQIAAQQLADAGVCKVMWVDKASTLDPAPGKSSVCDLQLGTLPAGLRAYQIETVQWAVNTLQRAGGALIAHEMGLGKSAAAIATCEVMQARRVLVLCPAVVVSHWEAQITRWASQFGVLGCPVPAAECKLSKAELAALRESMRHWIVTSHDMGMRRMARDDLPGDIEAVIIDECHAYSNPRAKRTEALRAWLSEAGSAKWRLGLSGTPMQARPRNLWSILDLLQPGDWGSQWQFQRRYCDGHTEELRISGVTRDIWVADGISHAEELHARLTAEIMIRRTKADVALELPPLQRVITEVPVDKQHAADCRGAAAVGNIADALAIAEAGKLESALELARECIEAGSRPLLLTLRKASCEWLAARLGVQPVTGDVAPGERAAELQAPGTQAGVATLMSVTTGIDLVQFDVVIMCGLDWVPSNMLQGEARAHRLGQVRTVIVHYLVALETVDEAVRERVIDRLDQFAAIMGGDASQGMGEQLRGGTEDEILQQIAALYMGDCK